MNYDFSEEKKNDNYERTEKLGENVKIYNKIDDPENVDGMHRDVNNFINYLKVDKSGFTNCTICGKRIGALDDMKIKDQYYCVQCKINIIDGESERDILMMRKNELNMELSKINYRIDALNPTSCFGARDKQRGNIKNES